MTINNESLMIALLSILTIEKKARILDTKSVGGHTGIVPIILFSNVGNHKNCGCSKSLDVDCLGTGQPKGGKKSENASHDQNLFDGKNASF